VKKLIVATLLVAGFVFAAPTHAAAQSTCVNVSFNQRSPGYGYILTNNCGAVENVVFATPNYTSTVIYLSNGETTEVGTKNNQPYKVWNCPSGAPYDPNGPISYNSENVQCRE
jgi:hypothetical protein